MRYSLKITHHRINNALAVLVIGVSLYALFIPFIPMLDYWLASRGDAQGQISRQLYAATPEESHNALLIPSILVDEPIVTGDSIGVINDGGIWLRPMSQEPDGSGNVILAGHRFTYQNPNGPLYHLDKVSIGDEIGVRWEGSMRRYEVTTIETVGPHETRIEQPTEHHQLTIYTCTPLLTADKRLVVTAREVL